MRLLGFSPVLSHGARCRGEFGSVRRGLKSKWEETGPECPSYG